MDEKEKILSRLSTKVFHRFRNRYSIALAVIALVFLISHYFVHQHLESQLSDSRVINVAGRQRMLSQKISKEVRKISQVTLQEERRTIALELEKDLSLWGASHKSLLVGDDALGLPGKNTEEIQSMFRDIEEPYSSMETHCLKIIDSLKVNPMISAERIQTDIDGVLKEEQAFLLGMDAIVFVFDKDAKQKVIALKKTERLLLIFGIITLLLELFFIFIPMANYLKKTITKLTQAEEEANRNADEIKVLYNAKEQSVQELKALNFAVDQAALFASISLDGKLIYMSKKLADFLGYTDKPTNGQFAEVLTSDEGEQQYIDEIIRSMRSNIWTGEVSITTIKNEQNWLELSMVPVNRNGVQQDYLIICSNITIRKKVELEIQQLNQEKFDEEIRLQKNRSLQIIKAQESERMRIAKDMHDGIGQMLTALKFNIESLNPENPEKIKQKIDSLKELSRDLIKGVRIATFNLNPPELSDFGLSTALSKLCTELNKLTNQNVLFENKVTSGLRLDPEIETNIYRIVQEAVNNAIKYAQANYILVSINHIQNLLSVSVSDDGVGFEYSEAIEQTTLNIGGHMGLTFMKERADYINGRLYISSEKGAGVRVTINVST